MKTIKRLLSIAAIGAAFLSMPAQAGLQDALDGMFLSNATAPQAFDSQSRGGFVGGSVAMRTPVRNINLVSFDPPRLSAGCGGIDMFGGSFSFINADQLVALFRQIAANAVGLAFKAAIDYINPALGKQMQEFQAKIQALNESMKDTCAVANSIVKTFTDPDARKEATDNVASAAATAAGGFDDLWAGVTSFFSAPNKAANDTNAAGTCPSCGNSVWKALLASKSADMLGNPDNTSAVNVNQTNEIIMSLIGTVIMNSNKPDTETTAGQTQKDVGDVKPDLLTLNDLMTGASDSKPIHYWHCTDGYDSSQCLQLEETTLTFQGMKGYVNTMMFGYNNGLATGVSASSIIGKLEGCSAGNCGFSDAQKSFLNSVQTPTLALVRKVQASQGAVEHVANRLVDVMATEITVKYGEAAIKATRLAFAGGKFPKDPSIDLHEQARMAELTALRQTLVDLTKQTMDVREYVKAVIEDNPAVWARVNTK